jgi:hypothetical protein
VINEISMTLICSGKPGEPVEEVLSTFCQRQGLSMDTCRVYYKKLVDKGEIKEK